jgi:hypothetical protein
MSAAMKPLLNQLPVLAQQPPHPVLGMLSAEDIALACKLAFSRQLWAEQGSGPAA